MTQPRNNSGESGSPAVRAALDALAAYAKRFASIQARGDDAVARVRASTGWPEHVAVERAIVAEQHRDQEMEFAALLPHTVLLIDRARTAMEFQPSARHVAGWNLLVDDLEAAADHARHLSEQSIADRSTSRQCHVTWADRARFLRDLAVQVGPPPPGPELPAAEEARWTAHAHDVRRRHMMYLYESRYDAAGRQITVVEVPDLDQPTEDCILIVAGDVDSATMRVLGRYDTLDQAQGDLPAAIQPGVLHPRGKFPRSAGKVPPLADLIEQIASATQSQEIAEVLDYVVSDGAGPRHLSQLSGLLAECADFALATETVTGRDLSVRLRGLMVQTDVLDRQLRHALIAFQDTIAVLPPHRTPQPRHLIPPPAVRSTPPPPPAKAAPPRVPRRL
ncbi:MULTISPECIES: hypothetical protein [Streptomyces]|uniref:Uncharacterized protein n=4 Tax=Streptomyces venezuelae TaxID=54571 RepID=F2R895_STRVP|nr:hypothetical protein [Streptomyces venezuelae]APE24457.1 hypothetical protein vnz_27775 [Streptomyces venezuelae]QES01823.1 hypothetical protein DEJ43_28230 [Streptomyces venezuelae ATCC 10712]CCA58904.1 hypothetical protein SVEN_5618 [Streptomyces venezuelae ATCC 10712]